MPEARIGWIGCHSASERRDPSLSDTDVVEEERLWTVLIDKYKDIDLKENPWRDDLVGRAFGNRGRNHPSVGASVTRLRQTRSSPLRPAPALAPPLGNARSRQGRLQEALDDLNESMRRCPWAADPVLNRGVVYEALDRLPEAEADYLSVLQSNPQAGAGNPRRRATAPRPSPRECKGCVLPTGE